MTWIASLAQDRALAEVFAPPADSAAELWLERAFEVAWGEAWISGSFDRVVVRRDEAGRATGATVFDFKTDEVRTDAEIRQRRDSYLEQIGR